MTLAYPIDDTLGNNMCHPQNIVSGIVNTVHCTTTIHEGTTLTEWKCQL